MAHNVYSSIQYWVIDSTSYLDGNIWAHPQLFGYTLLAMAMPVV